MATFSGCSRARRETNSYAMLQKVATEEAVEAEATRQRKARGGKVRSVRHARILLQIKSAASCYARHAAKPGRSMQNKKGAPRKRPRRNLINAPALQPPPQGASDASLITNHYSLITRPYCVADFSPSLRIRSCNFLRKIIGAFGLNATRYHKGCVRSLLSRDKVAASLLGCRAIFSRIAEYG